MAINAMHVAKTGLNAQQVRMQVISNNLANVNTNGFKGTEQILNPSYTKLLEVVELKPQLILSLLQVFRLVLV